MHCVEFEMRLNELLDERLPPASDPLLESHAAECSECADLLIAHEALLDCAHELSRFSPRTDLAVRVAAELAQPAARRRWNWNWVFVATAAALLISLGFWRWHAGANALRPDANGALVAQPHNLPVPSVPAAASNSRPTDLALLISQDAQQVTTNFSAGDWTLMEKMADGLKPVADSMSAAWDALRRTWPHGGPTARST